MAVTLSYPAIAGLMASQSCPRVRRLPIKPLGVIRILRLAISRRWITRIATGRFPLIDQRLGGLLFPCRNNTNMDEV